MVAWGLGLQVFVVLLVLGVPAWKLPAPGRWLFEAGDRVIRALVGFTGEGMRFVFGGLAGERYPEAIFVFQALVPIVFFSALIEALYHLGLFQRIVRWMAWVMHKTFGVSGAEALSAAANVFVGQVEAPLVIRPYLSSLTISELFCVMTAGMATVAANVIGAYVLLLQDSVPDIGGHILTASAMAAPAAVLMAKIMMPETGRPQTFATVRLRDERRSANFVEALAQGASDGLQLALTVAAMVIAAVALVALLDAGFGFSSWVGRLFAPVAWVIGVPWAEAPLVGELLAKKIVLNEFVAYRRLVELAPSLSPRTLIVSTYALCGFANFASVGILVGALGALVPNQRAMMSRLGFKSLVAASLANLLAAAIVGLFF
jgi:CNT family concentrative nucleoside transporter